MWVPLLSTLALAEWSCHTLPLVTKLVSDWTVLDPPRFGTDVWCHTRPAGLVDFKPIKHLYGYHYRFIMNQYAFQMEF